MRPKSFIHHDQMTPLGKTSEIDPQNPPDRNKEIEIDRENSKNRFSKSWLRLCVPIYLSILVSFLNKKHTRYVLFLTEAIGKHLLSSFP
jgi:hypothetical protein